MRAQNSPLFVYMVGILAGAKEREAADALARYLPAPDAARVIKAKGMEPAGS
jgi:hypothetical protein